MLQRMRERMQGIIAAAIVLIICITFAFWGIQNYLQARSDSGVAAKVNKVKITSNQLQAAYDRARQVIITHMSKDFSFDQVAQAKLKTQVLQQLINSKVIFQAAQALGFQISPQQVNTVLTQLPIFQVRGHFSVDRFQLLLSRMLYSATGFMTDLEQRMITSQLQMGLVGSAFALPNEITNFVKLIKQTRDIGYTIIPAAHFVAKINVSDQDVEKYYQQHQQEFTTPEQVSISYLELSADQLRAKIQVAPVEMQQFYDDNIDLYSHPKSWQVARIFVALPDNVNSAVLKQATAKLQTLIKQEQFSKPIWLAQGQIPQQLQIGQVSKPIRTQDGLYVMKLLRVKKSEVEPFAKVQDQVKKALIQQKTTKLFDQENNKLSDLTYTNSNTLQVAAKQLDLPIKTTQLFARQGAKDGLLTNPKIIKAVFSDAVLKQDYNSNPIEIVPGQVVVLRIKQHKPISVKPLSAIAATVRQQLITQQAGQQAQELGNKLLAAMQRGESAEQVVEQQGLTWTTFAKVARQQPKINRQIISTAFNLPITSNKPAATGIKLDDGSYAVVQVTKVYPGNVKQTNAQQLQNLKHAIALSFGHADYELLINESLKKAKVNKPHS